MNTQDKVSRTKAGSPEVGEQLEDERVIAAIRREGVGVLPLLTPQWHSFRQNRLHFFLSSP